MDSGKLNLNRREFLGSATGMGLLILKPQTDCVSCHMPKIEQSIADINVRSHTFRFITPAMTDAYKIPNPCMTCHKDKSTAWTTHN